MCGICGKVARGGALAQGDTAIVAAMVSALRHRGPDGNGQADFAAASLGHARLSIIDLFTGAQPMSNEENTVCVVFNGEIYNYQELRKRLEGLGHFFRTKSDTEVIIHAYEQYGEDCVREFRGMFAFALWDEMEQQLLLARDRLGKKPLFYAQTPDGLVFASGLRALLCDPKVSDEMDPDALFQYLRCGLISAPLSIYKSIRKLPPAHTAVYRDGELRLNEYWRLEFTHDGPHDVGEALEALAELLEQSVRLRLMADVPLGAFLSGGVDSTVVVGAMTRLVSTPVRTFCIGFPEPELDERRYAEGAAEVLGTDHETFEMGDVSPDLVETVAWHYGEPYCDASALPTFALSELTSRHVTVALNGDGGDELFGGYGRYYYMRGLPMPWDETKKLRRAILQTIPEHLHPRAFRALAGVLAIVAPSRVSRLQRLVAPLSERYWDHLDPCGDEGLQTLVVPDIFASVRGSRFPQAISDALTGTTIDTLAPLLHADIVGPLADVLLVKVDVASMAHGLECRCPLLDQEIVEFAASLPPHLKTHPKQSKLLLKELAARYVPREFFERRKQGFTPPIGRWLRTSLSDLVDGYLRTGHLSQSGMFQREGVESLVDAGPESRNACDALWRLLMFEAWYAQRPVHTGQMVAKSQIPA
ncbi:MAG: asparagine synthase (glutamine-hydrolyzing) [Armatimonadetes bacterium]|nr:asparagine synthase (glutamine-hydrolyzing) [Armatimonadota bacterium]